MGDSAMTDQNHRADDSRDILIALRADMGHVLDAIKHFQASDTKQWEKLDAYGVEITTLSKDVETNKNDIKSHKDGHAKWVGYMIGSPAAILGLWTLIKKLVMG